MRLMPELQRAIYAHLVAYPDLDALLPRAVGPRGGSLAQPAIYDHPPQAIDADADAAMPYVLIGDDTAIPWDTETSVGVEATLTMHVWSRYRGRLEVKKIQAELYNALHRAAIPLSGGYVIESSYEYGETIAEDDGMVRHGIQRFRVFADSDTL